MPPPNGGYTLGCRAALAMTVAGRRGVTLAGRRGDGADIFWVAALRSQ